MTSFPSARTFVGLVAGDPFPQVASARGRTGLSVETLAGRYVLLCFFGSGSEPAARAALEAVLARRDRLDGVGASLVAVMLDPAHAAAAEETWPGLQVVVDAGGELSRRCGALPRPEPGTEPASDRPFWAILDPTLHVLATFPLADRAGAPMHEAVLRFVARLPAPGAFAGFEIPPPVLFLPNVLEPALCRHLIGLYDAERREESGVARGSGADVVDGSFKRRRDFEIADRTLLSELQARTMRRILPEIQRLFFMPITRMERYIVGCYAAEEGGHFAPHRDNSGPTTAHRRFAISINLNDDFEGGALSFPEYTLRGYRMAPGWAVVFPANVLHAVSRVTAGRRYALLFFVFDEGGARIREQSLAGAA